MPSAGFTFARVGALALAILLLGLLFPGLFAPLAVKDEPKTVHVWSAKAASLPQPATPVAEIVTHREVPPHVTAEAHPAPHDSGHGK